MAVITKPAASKLKLSVVTTADGKDKIVSKTYGNVKPDASDEGVYTVGKILADLQEFPLSAITRVDETQLSSDGQ